MVAIIPQNGPKLDIRSGSAIMSKRTSNPSFSQHMQRGASQATRVFAKGAGTLSGAVPGAAILSNAFHQAANKMGSDFGQGSKLAQDLAPSLKMSNFLQGSGAGTEAGGTGTEKDGQGLAATMEELQDKMMSNNMYMLGVQREFQQMSEFFTTVSNLLRIKHDTEKNSISNIR